jgi:N-acetylmuramoyl-L-alanine amidase
MRVTSSLLLLGSAIAAALLSPQRAPGDPQTRRSLLVQAQSADSMKEPVVPKGAEDSGLPGREADRARLTAVRFLSSPTYTRVTMDLTQPVRYEVHRLKEDAAKGLPPRIYIDIFRAKLAVESKEPLVVDDGLLRHVRVGQFTPDVVRVVLDMNSLRAHNTFLLPDPYRLVVDIQGQKRSDNVASTAKGKGTASQGRENNRAAPSPASAK